VFTVDGHRNWQTMHPGRLSRNRNQAARFLCGPPFADLASGFNSRVSCRRDAPGTAFGGPPLRVSIAEKLGVSQPTVSEHLKVLSQAGLLRPKRIKQWTFYKRDEASISKVKRSIIVKI
jgi:DNA-binding transcriptional ArsR family regulator